MMLDSAASNQKIGARGSSDEHLINVGGNDFTGNGKAGNKMGFTFATSFREKEASGVKQSGTGKKEQLQSVDVPSAGFML